MGYVKCDEPFARLVHQGVILGADGNKMSKSLGNTVSPDEYVQKYGSDVFRMYLGFGFSFTDGGPWNDDGLKAIDRFLSRVERFVGGVADYCKESGTEPEKYLGKSGAGCGSGSSDSGCDGSDAIDVSASSGSGGRGSGCGGSGGSDGQGGNGEQSGSNDSEQCESDAVDVRGSGSTAAHASYTGSEAQLNYVRHNSIKFATIDTEKLQFNTAIAKSMELLNALHKYDAEVKTGERDIELYVLTTIDLLKLIAPFAPHFAEEMWESLGLPYSIFNREWPGYEEGALVRDVVEMAVQVNGAVRFKIEAPSDMDNDAIEACVRNDGRLAQFTGGKTITKVIVIRGRLVNIVAK